MKAAKTIKAYYVGKQLPEYFGKLVDVRDDYSRDYYFEIRFPGEKKWRDGFTDIDFSVSDPGLVASIITN